MNKFIGNLSLDRDVDQDMISDSSANPQQTVAYEHSQIVSRLYNVHRQDLMQLLQSVVKDREVAEELLHDTFIKLTSMPTLDVIRKPRPFLIRVARNLALDYLRQQKSRPTVEIEEAGVELIAELPEHLEVVLKERRVVQLKQTIAELPPRAREALMLAKFREMTLREVAKEMGISQTMVEKHLKTALRKCRVALGSGTPEDGADR